MNKVIETKICPVTGLEIIESNRWKNLKLADNYMISYRKIGAQIVDVHGYGNVVDFDADRFQNFLEKFVEDQNIQLPYVEMRNFEDLNGVLPSKKTLVAQKNYILENKDKRIGFVVYNATKTIGMLLMSGQRQYKKINISMAVEKKYSDAVKKSTEILKDYSPYQKRKFKNKTIRISSEDIETVAQSCGQFLWEEDDLFDIESLDISVDHPLYPIIENFAIVREELVQLENESFKQTKALEIEKMQTEKIVESLQSGIIIVDPIKDQIIDVNPAACEMLGCTKEKIIGKPFSDFLMDNSGYKKEQSRDGYLLSINDEPIPVLRSSVNVRLNNKNYILENFVDISEAKEHEEKLKKSLAHTKQLNSLTFNREKRIIEMKKEVNDLLLEMGKEPKYKSVIDITKD